MSFTYVIKQTIPTVVHIFAYLKDVNQLYTSTKQNKPIRWNGTLKIILTYDTVLMFYDNKIFHKKISVILCDFVIHFSQLPAILRVTKFQTHTINQVVYTVVMNHIWCVLLPVRWCVLVERWNSTVVQLAKFIWKSTRHFAVLLVLNDQFCNSYCWTVYWEMSLVDKVTWV
jgi:hypothetical protein